MRLSDRQENLLVAGKDYPRFKGDVKLTLHNPTTGKNEIYEHHNAPTNALRDIFAGNYGGLANYQNFADLCTTWLGGVLVFTNPLDISSSGWADDYGIPANTSNALIAHAGQVALSDQADDLTRGNPDSSQMVKTASSVKLVFEWGTSAGIGTISSLGLSHSDVGSYGCGIDSTAQKSLNPFAEIGCLSRQYTYDDNADSVLAIDGNTAYNIYFVDNTTAHVYKTPINNTKYKLQGGSLLPLTDYKSMITVTLSASYALNGKGDFYYHFDFANNKLLLFGVPTEGGTSLYIDEVDLSSWQNQTATHTAVTVTGAKLWKNRCDSGLGGNDNLSVPKKAMIYNNHLYIYGYSTSSKQPNSIYIINLANTADISSVDTTAFSQFYGSGNSMRVNERFAMLGGIIVHDSFLINSDKAYGCMSNSVNAKANYNYSNTNSISSPAFFNRTSTSTTGNMISVNKLYLATKWNLDSSINKTSAQSMTIEYTISEQ